LGVGADSREEYSKSSETLMRWKESRRKKKVRKMESRIEVEVVLLLVEGVDCCWRCGELAAPNFCTRVKHFA
jgi:hypothetical protein